MLSQEIVKKIKLINIQTRRLLAGMQPGQHRSNKKGYGLEFDQIREYEPGDDVRYIDWNSSARMNKLLVKQYIHEYNKTLMICLDISASVYDGSHIAGKSEILAQVATVLTLAGQYNNANVGLLLFSDGVEEYIPPKTGANHVQYIMQRIWQVKPKRKNTRLQAALTLLASLKRKDMIAFMLSDFIDQHNFFNQIAFVNKKCELVAIRCLDVQEKNCYADAFVHVIDPETQQTMLLDAQDRGHKSAHFFIKQRARNQEMEFRKRGIDFLDVQLQQHFIDDLIKFFVRKMVY